MTSPRIEPRRILEIPLRNFLARVHHFEMLDSTSTFLKEYAQNHSRESSEVLQGIGALADAQSAGRGRMGRAWHSPPGQGLYFSLLLKPEIISDSASLLTLMAAIATAEAIRSFSNCPLDIKWPNDILLGNRKVAGILTEASFTNAQLSYVVLGIGVNLNQKYFPAEIDRSATSLYLEARKEIDRDSFLRELLKRVDHWYGVLLTAPIGIVERWQQLSSFAHGKSIRVEIAGQPRQASTCGLSASGALRAKTADGQLITLIGSEVAAAEEGA
jgi:BirA family biotin operon repressor/biotin-[acetyl-CoA-carboxylase] ligase